MVIGLLHKAFAQHSNCADPLIDLFGAKIRVRGNCTGHPVQPSVLSETYLLLLIGGTATQGPVESPVCISRFVEPDGAGDRGKRLTVRSQGQYLVVYNGRLRGCGPTGRVSGVRSSAAAGSSTLRACGVSRGSSCPGWPLDVRRP